MSRESRRAIFGGSFDPIHNGHLMVAELMRQLEHLEQVIFVPAAQSPHKGQARAAAESRLRMVQAAVRGVPYFRCSRVEVDRPAPSWTIDTLRLFRRRWRARPYLLLGGDALLDLHSWRESDAILEESRIIVYARPGAEAAEQAAAELGLPYHGEVLSTLSSSALRRLARRGLSLRWQVPEAVRRLIETENLYRQDRDVDDLPAERHRHP
jgi:nicotinate-nucleotide adenylyltransferase